uniref:Uncharacterized protein n=1 Tax=Acrobeloides nanus TaxID=290746 RepID=A0A914D7G6_9BILA
MKAKKPKPPEDENRKTEKLSHFSISSTGPKVKRFKTSKESTTLTSEPQPLMSVRIQRPANLPPVTSVTWRDSSTNIPQYNESATPSSS